MTKAVREFLAAEGATEEEVGACELALVEACNNAVLYATPEGKKKSVEVEASLEAIGIELKVHDHTNGFRMPEITDLPVDESESGRGLFLMRSLMDVVAYKAKKEGNTLILKKNRTQNLLTKRNPTDLVDTLHKRLQESEHIITDMMDELSSCYESLSAIFRAGAQLGKTNNLEEFSRTLGKELLEITGADWYVFRIVPKDDSRLVLFVSHPVIETGPLPIGISCDADSTAEMKAAVGRRDVWFHDRAPLDPCDPLRLSMPPSFGLVHPFFFGDILMGTLTVGKAMGRPVFNAANSQVVHTFAEFLGIQVANARMRDEQINHQLVSHELKIARNIQHALLPRVLPQFSRVNLAGFYESARQVGGDFYDVIPLGDESLLLVLADVMGKGIPAAMFAAIFRSLLRSSPELNMQPGALLSRVNRLLFNDLSDVDMFITAQVIFVDAKNNRLTIANAGHCPVLLTSQGAAVEVILPEGMPIGILPEAEFPETTHELSEQARLLVYTDGLTETRNAAREMFGQDRLVELLSKNRHETADQLKKRLAEELAVFRSNAPLEDDLTFLLLAREKE
ncbi:MAG: Protein serine/threonine phosphatase [Verrucomicrobiales bacterium]|nr:Protein serine/threonine phosphatase [Verrucomicrobiales bacterium]